MIEQASDDELQATWQEGHANRPRSGCLAPEQLMRLVLREGIGPEREAAADHLSACTACAQEYRLLRELQPWARSAAARLGPGASASVVKPARAYHTRPGLIWSSLGVAALLAIVIGTTLSLNRTPSSSDAPRAAAPGGDQPNALPPVPPAPRLRLEKPPLKLTAAVALQWRSGAEAASISTAELTRALDAYRRDDFVDADTRLEAIARRDPRLAEAHFYLGVSKLFLEQPAAAVDPLRQAGTLAPDIFSRDVAWYLAVAYDALGDRARALAELRRLCADRQDYAAQACAAVREMSSSR